MISRRTRVQLLAFALMASLGVVYVGGKYAGLDRLIRPTTYTVKMELADSGGIFSNAEVTYRGVQVGRVGDLHPTATGVVVDLRIKRSAEPIPATGLTAEVKNLSIVGELYVDLSAASHSRPYLHGGSVIHAADTTTPVPPAELLASLNNLLGSVPQASLRTVLSELDSAFQGTGPDLARLLDHTSALVDAADQSLVETTRLIHDGATVLRTQNDRAGAIRSFSKSLELLTAQLQDSDPDLRRLVGTAPQLATQALALLRETGPGLSQLVADLLATGRLAEPRNAALRQLLITYPALARAAYSAVPGDGTAHFGLVLNAFDPLPCTQGYESTRKRSGTDTADIPVNDQATCSLPKGDPSTVRGSQNVPRAGVPQAVTAPTGRAAATPAPPSPELLAALRALLRDGPAPVVTDPTQILAATGGVAR